MKVTNNHTGPLMVDTIEVRPKATVEVDDARFDKWSNGAAAKAWLKQGIITTGEPKAAKTKAEDGDKDGDKPTEREQLLAKARELGLNPNANTSNAKLKTMVEEAEAEKAK